MTPLYHPRPERWPQFTLRGLFVVVTVLGVFLGWLGVQLKWIRDRHEALRWLDAHQVVSPRDWTNWPVIYHGNPPWSLRMFGETGVGTIALGFEAHPNDPFDVEQLKALFPEAYVDDLWTRSRPTGPTGSRKLTPKLGSGTL